MKWNKATNEDRLTTAATIVASSRGFAGEGNLRTRAENLAEQLSRVTSTLSFRDESLAKIGISEVGRMILWVEAEKDSLFFGTLLDWRLASRSERMGTVYHFWQAIYPTASHGELLDLCQPYLYWAEKDVEGGALRERPTNAELEKQTVIRFLFFKLLSLDSGPTGQNRDETEFIVDRHDIQSVTKGARIE